MITRSGSNRARHLDRLGHGAGLGDDLESGPPVEHRHEALADDLVIVDDEQPMLRCAAARSSPSAPYRDRWLIRRVPAPGSLVSGSVPPTRLGA